MTENNTAIVLAAGQGKRMQSKIQKQFLEIQGYPVLYYSLRCFQESPLIENIILVTGEEMVSYCKEEIVDKILKEFGLPVKGAHIINGHIPVIVKKGESPVKCGGKLLIIDGGFSKAYQQKTGIAGYTLIYNSYGLVLAAHEPFTSMEDTVLNETCIHSHIVMEQNVVKRKTVNDTDTGKVLRENIAELEELLQAYRSGLLVERF